MALDLDEDGYADLMAGRRRLRQGIDDAVPNMRALRRIAVCAIGGEPVAEDVVREALRESAAWLSQWDDDKEAI